MPQVASLAYSVQEDTLQIRFIYNLLDDDLGREIWMKTWKVGKSPQWDCFYTKYWWSRISRIASFFRQISHMNKICIADQSLIQRQARTSLKTRTIHSKDVWRPHMRSRLKIPFIQTNDVYAVAEKGFKDRINTLDGRLPRYTPKKRVNMS